MRVTGERRSSRLHEERRRTLAALGRHFAVATIALLGVGISVAAIFGAEREQERWVRETREVASLARAARALATDRESGLRGFLLTNDRRSLAAESAARVPLARALDSLVVLTAADVTERRRAVRIRDAVERWEREYATPSLTGDASALAAAPAEDITLAGQPLFDEVRAAFVAFTEGEDALYAARVARTRRLGLVGLAAVLCEIFVVALVLAHLWRRFAYKTRLLMTQQSQIEELACDLEEQAVELEEQAAELEAANVELSSAVLEAEGARAAAQETADTLRAVIDSSPVAIITTDLEGHVLQWNDSAERLFGWPRGDVVGRPDPVVPAERAAEASALRDAALRERATSGLETERRRRDGTLAAVSLSLAPLRAAEGVVNGFIILCADLSERNEAQAAQREIEASYRRLVEFSPDGIMVHSEGTIVFANPAMARLLGRESPAELVGTRVMEIVHPSCRALLTELIDRAERRRTPTALAAQTLLRADGAAIEVEVAGIPFTHAGRHAVQAVVRDVSERKRLEARLRQAQKMEAIGLLSGGVAHDFNNMLTAIKSYSELVLMDAELARRHREDVVEIGKAADRAAKLTRQLLAFSRQQVLRPQVMDLNAVVADIEGMLRRLMVGDVELVTVLAQSAGFVEVDRGQLEQVLLNLAVNARDAMPGGGRLTIESAGVELDATAAERLAAAPGGYVMLSMTDTGCGMDAATQERIFDPFFTTKESGSGTGLGLSTVYGIVRQSGGHISVHSEPGHGSTFKIYLPRGSGVAGSEPAAAPPRTSVAVETILLVDDEAPVRAPVKKFLQQRGYTVLEAHHGRAALELSERYEGEIDLLITDLMMPEVGGRELVGRISRSRPSVKVLFTSGYTNDDVIRRGLLEPGMAFLQKPFTLELLSATVREMLDAGGRA